MDVGVNSEHKLLHHECIVTVSMNGAVSRQCAESVVEYFSLLLTVAPHSRHVINE